MITFKQFLSEVLQGKDIFPWRETKLFGVFAEARFDSFVVLVEKLDERYTDYSSYRVSFADESISSFSRQVLPTGTRTPREAIKIYNTIGDIIRSKVVPYLKSNDVIYFEAASSRTFRIYEGAAKKLAKEINGNYKRVGDTVFKVIKK